MNSELEWLLLGAVAGVALDEGVGLAKRGIDGARALRRANKFNRLHEPSMHTENIVALFRRHGRASALYRPATLERAEPLPILWDAEGNWVGEVAAGSDAPLRLAATAPVQFPFDEKLIRAKKAAGLRLWNGSVLYSTNNGPLGDTLPVGICNYYGYVAVGDRILRESLALRGPKPNLRGRLSSFASALSQPGGPVALAASVTCVFESADGRVFAHQQRAPTVVNARDQEAVVPLCGLEPNESGGLKSRFGVLTYNFLKEFLEEFFGQPELERAGDEPDAPHPDYIFETDLAKALICELEEGRLTLFVTGASLDLTDGSLVLALLAHFRSVDYHESILKSASGSWEAAARPGSRIQFTGLWDARVAEWLTPTGMVSTSAFSLDRARLRLRDVV